MFVCHSSVYGQTTTFLPWDSDWRYYDLANQPPTISGNRWSDTNYDDSFWASGDAELGYGDGDEETVINSSALTAYFRKDFVINNPCQYEDIKIRIWHDDGSVVYLNGVDVWRLNMPNGPISYNTFASSSSGDNAVRTITLPVSAFNGGMNTIAVETHQISAGSSDISFNMTVFGDLDAQTSICSCNGSAIMDSDGDGVCDDIDLCDNSAGPCTINLSQYSFCYSNILTAIPDDFSGITYNFDSKTFYSVENDKSKIFELDTDGNILRTVTLVGFDDVEGLVYFGNNEFAVAEERRRRVVFINIPPGGSNITRSYPGFNGYIQITGAGSGSNDGLEGIAYSPVDDLLYLAKEKTSMALFSIQNPMSKKGSSITPNQPFSLVNKASGYPGSGGFTDIAGLSFTEKGTLLLLSEEGNSLVEVDPFTGNMISSMSLSAANNSDVEGVIFISPGELVFASEPNEFYRYTVSGSSCDDGNSCTTNDAWNGCNCSGTLMDSDGDGICDGQDSCPNLNNGLIGNLCNDGDPCTTNDRYTSACNCEGTFQDSDNDGVCDVNDSCPSLNNSLIGSSCNDGDPCTSNDVITSACQCAGTPAADSDNDGVCDINDACPGQNDGLIGQPCNDANPCTTNDIYSSSCNCVGTPGQDSDGDGVCDAIDACPGFNDNLIGISCNDGNSCTINDRWTSACNCVGTPVSDSDGDGVCDVDDACPGLNDGLIGQPCNDGISCTTNDRWTSACNCAGTPVSDSDGDGVCDVDDACPGFNDGLIGQPCNDGNSCTSNDVWTTSCTCSGTPQTDSDNDGTCDANDGCPNDPFKTSPGLCGCGSTDVDSNNNGVCDIDESNTNCPASTFVAGFPTTNTVFEARRFVTSNGTHDKIGVNVDFSAGQLVTLLPGFEVKKGAIFHGYIDGCN